jgi:(p)ppGpp synthase/HD superfamily hydrolase
MIHVIRRVVFCSSMTHDVLEDSGTGKGSKRYEYEDLGRLLGFEVANVVKELTKDDTLPKAEQRARMIEGCKTMSPVAKFIKLCDRLSNLREMDNMGKRFIARYCQEARQMVANMQGTCELIEKQIIGICDRHEGTRV